VFFGFGGRSRVVSRWVTNFEDAHLIRVRKGEDGVWMVELL
jgi:hypothetical protein